MTTPTPRRPRRSHAEQEADLKAKLAALEKRKLDKFRDDVKVAVGALRIVAATDIGFDCAEIAARARDMANGLAGWLGEQPLSSAKPGEGK